MILFPKHVQDVLQELADKGFAVVIFTPKELQGVNPDIVEEEMVIKGWNTIEDCKHPSQSDFNWEDEDEVYPAYCGELS